jgi:hypothetical protein
LCNETENWTTAAAAAVVIPLGRH